MQLTCVLFPNATLDTTSPPTSGELDTRADTLTVSPSSSGGTSGTAGGGASPIAVA